MSEADLFLYGLVLAAIANMGVLYVIGKRLEDLLTNTTIVMEKLIKKLDETVDEINHLDDSITEVK